MGIAWGKITVKEILPKIDGSLVAGTGKRCLAGISTDSRTIKPGQLFWSLKGDQYDGHDFVLSALEQGAAGVVIEKDQRESVISRLGSNINNINDPVVITVHDTLRALGDMAGWWRSQHNIQVIAITGSVGKTTTKEMLAEILSVNGRVLKNYGNFNNLIGLPLTLLRLDNTYEKAVVEMGMNRPGEIARLTEIGKPDVGVVTNVEAAHLEGVRDLQGVANAKTELVKGISPKSHAIINGDNDLLVKTASKFRTDLIKFGLDSGNDVTAQKIREIDGDWVSFDLVYRNNRWPVKLRVPGRHNIFNALAACAAGLCLNELPEHIAEGLYRFKGIKGRFMVSKLPNNIMLVDDTYNSNPSSLKAALTSIKSLGTKRNKTIICLGDMLELGNASVSAHRKAGHMVAKLPADLFIIIGNYACEMRDGALMAGLSHDRIMEADSHQEILRKIRAEMSKGTLVFIKGSHKVGLEKVVKELICQA